MTKLHRLLRWILKAAVFFALFAFALNNQQEATVHFLFGGQWRAPMMLIVLAAFSVGVVIGVLGMLSSGWARRTVDAAPEPVKQNGPASVTDGGAQSPAFPNGH